MAELLDGELARRLRTIPGVGPAIVATLIAEIGDIHRFDDFDQLVAYVGVHPAEQSSGRKGADPDQLAHGQDRERLPARRALPDGRRQGSSTTP